MSRIPFAPFTSPELDVAADTRSTLLRAGSRRYHATDGEFLPTAAEIGSDWKD